MRGERIPFVGCIPDSELFNCFGVEASTAEVGADFACLFPGTEGLVIELCGLFEEFADFLSFFSVRSICGVGVAEGYAESVSEPFDSAYEVQVFDFADECDGVTTFLATEAIEEPFVGVNRK